jgi:DNA-binding XRE family transcriptional regulator
MNKPQIIESNGKPAFVVLPYEDWRKIESLMEDAEDNAALAKFRSDHEETVPIAIVDALLAGDNPVRVYRKHRGLTLAVLAHQSDIATPYLSQIETGKRRASTDVLKRLASVLGVGIDDLMATRKLGDTETR